MLTEKQDTAKADESALEEKPPVDDKKEPHINETEIETAIKQGLNAPYSKVLLRLMLALLIITSLGMFITGVMKYNEFQREKSLLEKEKAALTDEIDELKYLIDCPMDYDYIVRVAREKLGLYLPDETIYYNDYNDTKK